MYNLSLHAVSQTCTVGRDDLSVTWGDIPWRTSTHLESLRLTQCGLFDTDVRHVLDRTSEDSRLESLKLDYNRLSVGVLATIMSCEGLRRLRRLGLKGVMITDDEVSVFGDAAAVRHLEDLDIDTAGMSERGARPKTQARNE